MSRSLDGTEPGRQAQAAAQARARGADRRSRHDHRGAHRGDHQTGRSQLITPCARRRSAACRAGTIQLSLSTSAISPRSLARLSRRAPRRLSNPLLADCARANAARLLDATEQELLHIQSRVRRAKKPLRGKDKIALAVGAVTIHYKMAKHFAVTISDHDLTVERETEQINAEALLDGIYVLRTDLEPKTLNATATVKAYKDLANVERAFRSLKTIDLEVQAHPSSFAPIPCAALHVLLCMLAYYLEWHMPPNPQPILFDDHDKTAAQAARASIVAKAERSDSADRKAATKRTHDGLPVHSFRSLLADLATVTRNTMAMAQKSRHYLRALPNI